MVAGTLRLVSSPPPFGNDWTTPKPPEVPSVRHRPIRGRRVALGVTLALLGHLLTVGLGFTAAQFDSRPDWLTLWVLAQGVLLIGCVIAGVLLLTRGDRGIGLGVLVGWAGGAVLIPVIAVAVEIVLLATYGVG